MKIIVCHPGKQHSFQLATAAQKASVLLDAGFNPTIDIENPEHTFQIINGITIYPKRYFCPTIHENEIDILSDTHSIHHYAASWVTPSMKLKGKISSLISKCVPVSVYTLIRKTYRLILQKK